MRELKGILHKEFLIIEDGDKRYYGGNQAWYDNPIGRDYGCGPVAASNVLAYYAKFGYGYTGIEGLYPYNLERFTKDEYKAYMDEILSYVKPVYIFGFCIGVWPASHMIKGIRKYVESKGLKLNYKTIHTGRKESVVIKEITEILNQDKPAMMLISINKAFTNMTVQYPNRTMLKGCDCSKHWVTVTGLASDDKGIIYLRVSTWGGVTYLRLSDWLNGWWPQRLITLDIER